MSDFGWQGRRRDVLAGLAGAAIAAGVLIPVGWWRVRAEQRQTERFRREAADRYDAHQADIKAPQAGRDR